MSRRDRLIVARHEYVFSVISQSSSSSSSSFVLGRFSGGKSETPNACFLRSSSFHLANQAIPDRGRRTTTTTRTIARRRPIDRFEPNEISARSSKAFSSQSVLISYSNSSSSSGFLEAGQIKTRRVFNWGRDAKQIRPVGDGMIGCR